MGFSSRCCRKQDGPLPSIVHYSGFQSALSHGLVETKQNGRSSLSECLDPVKVLLQLALKCRLHRCVSLSHHMDSAAVKLKDTDKVVQWLLLGLAACMRYSVVCHSYPLSVVSGLALEPLWAQQVTSNA
eukprot:4409326-Amphidinium_carterae.1